MAAFEAVSANADAFFDRHRAGEWGEVDDRVRRANEFAVKYGHTMFAISSQYPLEGGVDLVVMTATDRTWTLMQLADEHKTREVDVHDGYAMWADAYDSERNALIAVEAPQVDSIVSELPIESALDVGAGTGRHALGLARRGIAVEAVDQSPEMLFMAEQTAEREGLAIHFRRADLETGLPCGDDEHDFLICALTLCHVSDLGGVVEEFYRVLRPGGFALITDIHPEVVELGWTARVIRPEATYFLPFSGHTRDDYLDSLTAAGFELRTVLDILCKDVPEEYYYEGHQDEYGDYKYCLIMLAQKPL